MNPDTIVWLVENARRAVDVQFQEGARVDTKARELVGFVGIVLALVATAASQAGDVAGISGILLLATGLLGVMLLFRAVVLGIRLIVGPIDLHDPTAGQVLEAIAEPELAARPTLEAQASALVGLGRAIEVNAGQLVGAQELLAQAYAVFTAGLGCTVLAVLIVLALVV